VNDENNIFTAGNLIWENLPHKPLNNSKKFPPFACVLCSFEVREKKNEYISKDN